MKYTSVALALFGLSPLASAVALWGQCGGLNFPPNTVCDPGLVCVYVNVYYSQCLLPATSTTAIASTSITTSNVTTPPVSSSTTSKTTSAAATTSTPPVSPCVASSNPYTGYEGWINPQYAVDVDAAVAVISGTNPTLAAKALQVKKFANFFWLDTLAKVPSLDAFLADARAQQTSSSKKKLIVQIVIYNLPDRDCHATNSSPELTIGNNGEAIYKNFIDSIAIIIAQYPDVRIVIILEPDALASLVINQSDPKCANAGPVYRSSIIYAINVLKHCNVWIYLDAAHTGILGWPANVTAAAQLFAQLFSATQPNRVRGLATNVGNYNAFSAATQDPITPPNPNYDELHYINVLAPAVASRGFPAAFIVEQGRSGQQNIRDSWTNSCNIEKAGFGIRPTTSTGSSVVDAIVWVKPGGYSDGSAATIAACGVPDSKQPSPVAGQWFQAYFTDLVQYANPSF